ncbi:MAG: Uma2 family endonuclease [Dehalococcoidia bacterium]|nr:Uma2 family endonuclease [Dehalococcoidia bacterium]
MSSIGAKRLTFEAWLALPETKQRYEIVDGVMLMPPAPTVDHQWIMQRIFLRLTSFVEDRGLGVVLVAPVDLMIQRAPLRTRQPDVLYLSAERSGIKGRADLHGLQYLEMAPDLVVEVLSPSNNRRDIEDKLADYRRIGVRECWLVSPEAETFEVLSLSAEEASTSAIFGVDGTLRSEILDDFTLQIGDVFS